MIDPKRWPDLSRPLDEALDIAPADRDRWLDSLPAADRVHQEELRTLLRHDAAAKQALSLAQAAHGTTPFSNRTGLAWLMLGRVLARQGNDAQAKAAFQAAVNNLSNTVDADHPKLLLARQLAHQL